MLQSVAVPVVVAQPFTDSYSLSSTSSLVWTGLPGPYGAGRNPHSERQVISLALPSQPIMPGVGGRSATNALSTSGRHGGI